MLISKTITDAVDEIIQLSSRGDQKKRLEAWSQVCRNCVEKSVPLTIANCVKILLSNGISINAQSIYNGNNSYKKIFEIYYSVNLTKIKLPKKIADEQSASDIVSIEDLKKIEDHTVRYRISLLLGELSGYKNQVNLLKDIRNTQQLHNYIENNTSINPKSSELLLDEYEIEILKEFVQNPLIEFDESGTLKIKTHLKGGTTLSSSGLLNALLKILRSYNAL